MGKYRVFYNIQILHYLENLTHLPTRWGGKGRPARPNVATEQDHFVILLYYAVIFP